VAAEVLEQGRGPKIIAFKKRRRKNSRRKRGHRQEFTLLRVTEILTDGAQPSKAAVPRRKPKPAAADTAAPEASQTAAPEEADRAEGAKAKARSAAKKPAKEAAKKPPRPKAGGKGKNK
jgi:large subunit ribosomal protein L21